EIVWGQLERGWGARVAGTEGGRLHRVFRRAPAAGAECARGNRAARGGYGYYRYDHRLGYDGDRARIWPGDTATFFEVAVVPSDVQPFAGVGFLVQRRAIGDSAISARWRDRPPRDARVPCALFADRGTADGHRDQLNTDCRSTLNPFV